LRACPVGDVVAVDDRFATDCLDLVDDLLRRGWVDAGAVVGAADVIDNYSGTLASEQKGVLAPQAAAGTGDDCDPDVELYNAIILKTKES
jgi:hypothetical protein